MSRWICGGPVCKCSGNGEECDCKRGDALRCLGCNQRLGFTHAEHERTVLDAQLDAEAPEAEAERIPVLKGQRKLPL